MIRNFSHLRIFFAFGFIAVLFTACGGNNTSESKAIITFTVDDILTAQKKSKDASDIAEVRVTDLAGNTFIDTKEIEARKYSAEVKVGSKLLIAIKLLNQNNDFTLEKYIEESSTEEVIIDQDSTTIASLIRQAASDKNQEIKEYLENNKGASEAIKTILQDIKDKSFIDKLLSSKSDQELIDLAEVLADAINELERFKEILENIKTRIEVFQGGIKDSENDLIDTASEQIADQLETPDKDEHNTSFNIDDNGEIFVIKNDEVRALNSAENIIKEPIVSGEVYSSDLQMIVLVIKTDKGTKTINLYNSNQSDTLNDLIMNIHPGDHITVKYEINSEEEKVITKIKGSGKTIGVLTSKTDNSITLLDEKDYTTTFTARYFQELESNTKENLNTESLGGYDPTILKIISTLNLKDKILIKWEIDETKRIIRMEKFADSDEDEDHEENTNNEEPDQEGENADEQKATFNGFVAKTEDSGFTFQINSNNEAIFIVINKEIAYHREILASLLIEDVITVTIRKNDGKYILENATGEGEMSGALIEKSETAIFVKNASGKIVKFTPEWHDGGLDDNMLAQFKEIEVGTSIIVKWKLEERKRAISISKN